MNGRYSKLAFLHRVKERKTTSLSTQASFAPFSLKVAWSGKSLIVFTCTIPHCVSKSVHNPLPHSTLLQCINPDVPLTQWKTCIIYTELSNTKKTTQKNILGSQFELNVANQILAKIAKTELSGE